MPSALPPCYWVYVLRCADGSLYTGIARDVAKRLAAHESGRGAKYTRGRGPLRLIAKTRCRGKGDALRVEAAVKRLRVKIKEGLSDSRKLAVFARKARAR